MKAQNGTDVEWTGGESVFCINQFQLSEARRLLSDADSGPRLAAWLKRLEVELTRNEQAALAFELIDRLMRTRAGSTPSRVE
jgi:hypothetical protein